METNNSIYFVSRFLLVVGFVCFIVLISDGEIGQKQWSNERVKHDDDEQVVVGKDKVHVVVNHDAPLDFNYMSKRRVPNGPDPIHNRRAGNSGRPPGQS